MDRKQKQKRIELCVKLSRILFHGVQGKTLSYNYRKDEDNLGDSSLTFGEISTESFLQILALTSLGSLKTNKIFVDLGSGIGRACICAALSPYGFDKVVGIEIIPSLNNQACLVLERLSKVLNEKHIVPGSNNIKATIMSKKNFDEEAYWTLKQLMVDTDPVSTDLFANSICKKLGHKLFREALKSHKSFLRYLQINSNRYVLYDDGKSVSLSEDAAIVKEDVENKLLENHNDLSDVTNISTESSAFQLTANDKNLLHPLPEIIFKTGDIFEFEWWQGADVVYVASLLFSDVMMEKLTEQSMKLNEGAYLITLKPLAVNTADRVATLTLRSESFYKMSWQMAKVFIYQITSPQSVK